MKIYNKKVFASGVFEMALGLLLLITSIVRQDLDTNSITACMCRCGRRRVFSFSMER